MKTLVAHISILCVLACVVLPTPVQALLVVCNEKKIKLRQPVLSTPTSTMMRPFAIPTTPTPTRLYAARLPTQPETIEQQKSTNRSSVNFQLIGQAAANQALIGTTIWTGGPGYQVLTESAHFGPFGIALGIAGVLPLLALSRQIETSESYMLSSLNLSTNMAVLRLFGPTPRPVLVLIISAFLSILTGVVEEVTFRGLLIPFFANRFAEGDMLTGAAIATILFAFLHTNPASFLKGGDAALDNLVLLALQLINGAAFALMYLATGNLAVPIVSHALYDLYTFYKTHMVDVAGQMEYAKQQKDLPNFKDPRLERRWINERGQEFVDGIKETFYLMDSNRDGVLSRKELRVALFSYGINLSTEQSAKLAQKADRDESGAIDLDEFLEFVGPTGNGEQAIRNTLFGPL